MIARFWRGWAAAESADEIAGHLQDVTLARFADTPGYVSASVLVRPQAGGVELMTFSLWESDEAVPQAVEESHRLLVARGTVADCWEVAEVPATAAKAA